MPPPGAKTAGAIIKSDGLTPFEGNQSLGGNRLTFLADPVDNQDAVTKAFLTTLLAGYTVPVEYDFAGALTPAGSTDTWTANATGTSVLAGPTNPIRYTRPYKWTAKNATLSVPANTLAANATLNIVKTTAAGVSTTIGTLVVTAGATTNGGATLNIDLASTAMAAGDSIDVEMVGSGAGTARFGCVVHGKALLSDVQ